MTALVVDDEKNIRVTLSACLEGMGCSVVGAASASQALAALRERPADLAFLDLRLGEDDGLALLPKLLAERPDLPVIVITAYATIDTAVEAIRRGAEDYLAKPFTPAEIRLRVEQIVQRRDLARRVFELEDELQHTTPEADFESDAPRMRALLAMLERAAPTQTSILLRGESGTGKTLLARHVHRRSLRRDGPFVVVNCPTLSEELLASEMFGHARGAFTGAVRDQPGRVEAAHGGTLLLDEISELSPSLQAKLLRFVQEKSFERIGESVTRRADVRLIAATNRDLEREVAEGRFREDLLFRLNVIEAVVPPLRERPEDVLRFARGFLSFFSRATGRATPALSAEAERALLAYGWPGNVRELRNVAERAAILWPGAILEPDGLPERISGRGEPTPRLGGDFSVEEIEREHIQRVVARSGTLEEAARILAIEPSTLWRKRKRYEGRGVTTGRRAPGSDPES